MIPIHSKIGQGMTNHFEKIVSWYEKNEPIAVLSRKEPFQFLLEPRSNFHRNQQCEQCSAVGKHVWQSSALVSSTKTLNRDVAPIGDDIEPIAESRADVGMRKMKNPWKEKIPRVRMNPKNLHEQRETRT